MRRFKFSLEKILELRKHREREAETVLGRAVGELTAAGRRLEELAVLSRGARDEFRNPAPAGNLADHYRAWDLYIRRLDQTKEELLEQAARARAKVEEARAAFLEASRDRKVLDKLREKQAAAYRRDALDAEIKTLDDMAGRRPSAL